MSAYDHWRCDGRDCAHDPRSPAYDATRDEAIDERADELVEQRMSDRALLADALDDMCGSSDMDPCGATTFACALANVLIADDFESAAIDYFRRLRETVHAKLRATAELDAEREIERRERDCRPMEDAA